VPVDAATSKKRARQSQVITTTTPPPPLLDRRILGRPRTCGSGLQLDLVMSPLPPGRPSW
jgi:hypothetical protein